MGVFSDMDVALQDKAEGLPKPEVKRGNIVAIDVEPAVLAEILFVHADWCRVRVLATGETLSLYLAYVWPVLDTMP